MNIEIDKFAIAQYEKNKLQLSICIDETDDEIDVIYEAMKLDKYFISFNFNLKETLDNFLQNYELCGHSGFYKSEDKAMFNAIRSELTEMIERIDAINYMD